MSHSYLVTGAAGFIGARVTEFLLAGGDEVVGVDNLNDAYDVRLKQWRLEQVMGHPAFAFRQSDVAERGAVEGLFSELGPFDAVINLAARAGVRPSVQDPWLYQETNVGGTLNLLEACRRYGVPKFILASTSSLYGDQNEMPYHEAQRTDHPISPYAASKKGAELLCHTYHYLYGLDVTIFRYFTVYGPAGRPDMAPFRFVQWITEGHPLVVFGDGQQSRDWTYVDDIARGTIAGLKPVGYEIVNLGSGTTVGLMEVIEHIERLVEQPAVLDYRPAHRSDVRATWADVMKAEALLGWRPQVAWRDGMRHLAEWYAANRDWAREIETGV